jgi:starvation-inducible DNA-binding protein
MTTKMQPSGPNPRANIPATTLNAFLADTYVLLGKTQACHWNATGPNFFGLHKLTEAQYAELFAAVDALAERVRAVGGMAPDGIGGMLELTTLETASHDFDTGAVIRMLAEDNAAVALHARDAAEEMEAAGDLASHDMLVSRIAVHEKAAWLLRSHIG